MRRTLVLTLLVSVMAGAVVGVRGPSASAQPGGPAWAPLMVPSPPGRSDGAMAANPAGGVVLFGGSIHPATGLVALGDTWTFYGEAWVEQHPPFGPPPRAQAAMAFDSARGVAVLFGGNTFTSRLGDTWTWDGTDWALEHPSTAPLARSQAAIAFDAARGVTLLFGGTPGALGTNDTWAWDGSDWTLLHPAASPPARVGATMAYDAARERVVLYGGCNPAPQNCLPAYDTWTWDGETWTEESPATSPAISGGSLAYHPGIGAVVLFGSVNENRTWQSQTWTWDGATWTQLAPVSSPPPRRRPPMAFDPALGVIVLFGGEDVLSLEDESLGDTWVLGP